MVNTSLYLNANKEYIVLNLVKGYLWENKDIKEELLNSIQYTSNISTAKDMDYIQIKDYLYKYISGLADNNKFKKFIYKIKYTNRNKNNILECEGLEDSFKNNKELQLFIINNIIPVIQE